MPSDATEDNLGSACSVSHDAIDRATPHVAHGRIAFRVVPDCSQRLLERPSFAALPLQLTALQIRSEQCPWTVIEEMPCRNQVERGIGGTKPSAVEHTNQSAISDEHVERSQVTVTHHVRGDTREVTEVVPQFPDAFDIEQMLTLHKTVLDPLVVIVQVSSPPATFEPATSRIDFAKGVDQVRQVSGEWEALARVCL